MAPKGTIPQRAAANCRLTRPISSMADAVPSPVSAAACSGASKRAPRATGGCRQSKDWEQPRLPHPPYLQSCVPVGRTTQQLGVTHTYEAMQTALCSTQPPWLAMAAATMPREKKLRSRRWPVGRAVATHRVQRRPHRPAPIRDARRHPGTQMRRPRAGARHCTRASSVRSDRMWSLPISPAAAIIYESIHSGALNGRVDSDGAVS
jgi:hypothetical protein